MTRPRTEELLAAYASGAALTDEERASVEALLAGSPAARAEVDAIGGLLGELREIAPVPPPASEAVVRAVRIACAQPVTWTQRARAWWRRRWMIAVPGVLAAGVLAAIAIVAAGSAQRPSPRPAPPQPIIVKDVPAPDPANPPADEDVPLYLAGEATELAGLDDDSADEIERVLGDELAAIGAVDGDDAGFDGLLPDDDLEWVDALDDETAEELDRWLAEQPS